MPRPPRFIYFDLGNVLLHFDHAIACRQMGELVRIPEQRVRDVLFGGDLQRSYEAGAITTEQFCQRFCEGTGSRADFQAIQRASSAIFELNVPMVPLVAHLYAAGHRLGILSNTCEAHWKYISDGRFRIIPELFEVCVLSFCAGAMKPSREIYLLAAERAGLDPGEILFLDDNQENVAGARQAGLDAIQYRCPQSLAVELRRRGIEMNY